ncbi:MAG: hypothetical protein HY553_04690 [Elusimicrobia bacterium]|nr:hypothetical protein [Elusimicrobiota bacterium]
MAELVSSGGFRVDRSRALEKLSAFQLDDAHKALLALIRCATASGAARIRLARKPRLELAFDGRPLTAAELEDPFAALFAEEGHGDVRSRQLALGILAMLPAAGALELTGGAAAGRRRLLIPSPASFATVDLKDDPSSETRLTFALGAPRALGDSSRLETDCWASRIPIYVDGRELPRGLAPDHPGVAFDEKGRYGWVSVPQAPAAPSLLRLHVLGTRIADGELPGNTIPVAGYVNGDDFALDAGQAKVVRNDALAEAGAAVERAAERLLGETVEALSRALPDTDRLLSSISIAVPGEPPASSPSTPLRSRKGWEAGSS